MTDRDGFALVTGADYLVAGELLREDGDRSVLAMGGRTLHVLSAAIRHAERHTSDHLQLAGSNLTTGATAIQLQHQGVLVSALGMILPHKTRFRRVSVVTLHLHGSPPSDWTLSLMHDGGSQETLSVSWDPAQNTPQISAGNWSYVWDPASGEPFTLTLTGSATDNVVARVAVELLAEP